jgi:D-alanyl-D-alanine carboxypeptidase/D-alanyl-D-alanine-endopeptidase (penicillin-binding protein 4)
MIVRHWTWGLILGVAAVAAARGDDALEARVAEVVRTPGYRDAHWGLLVVDGRDGRTVYERDADRLFRPASVTKLFTTAAALADLGADFRFQTPVHRRGEVDADGTLRGDLILVAQGDLSLGGRTGPDGTLVFENHDHSYANGNDDSTLVPTDPLAGLDHLAREVRAAEIKAVSGDVVVDDRLFEAAVSTGSGPSRVSPVVINDNVVDVVVTPGTTSGEPAALRIVPASAFYAVDAQVETAAEGTPVAVAVRPEGARRFSVQGQVPVGHRPVVRTYEVEEPAAFARALLIERLRARGVRVRASPLADDAAERLPTRAEVAALPKVAEYTSPPFREYVRVILKVSQNLHASTLPLLVAAHHGETTLEAGLRREGVFLRGLGLDPHALSFGGGAGGSRADLVTPGATVALLRAMAARPEFPAFETALPVLGRDGTSADHVPADSPVRGHVRAKTGTYWVEDGLTGQAVLTSKALAGYMETASGRPLVFAFFVNDVPLDAAVSDVSEATTAAGRLLGRLCEVFYTAE